MTRRSILIYALLAGVWALVGAWQIEEHVRVQEAAKADLRNRSKVIANTLSAIIRGMRFRGAIPKERIELVLTEMVRTNEPPSPNELVAVALLNASNFPVVSAGRTIDPQREDLLQEGEHWGQNTVTLVNPVNLGASLSSQGVTNTLILPPLSELTNRFADTGRGFPRHGSEPPEESSTTNLDSNAPPPGPPPHEGPPGGGRGRRPAWLRNLDDPEFRALLEKRALHGLVLVLSTESLQAASDRDLWLRSIIMVLATCSALGAALAFRNLAKSSDLQLRLVRASELTTHLREMNLAAAGLAHETRNPLNIIRGRAQIISKQAGAAPDVRQCSKEIVEEADKVAAQLNEFINYSRPREVRRSPVVLRAVINEVARALTYDIEEKKITLQVKGEQLRVEADEQLLRQALFNLLLNAIQAVDAGGAIEVAAEKFNTSEVVLEMRDNGPGVPPERRTEIFKPYFTMQKQGQGTGLGLAVVQQIVLAHGWEIQCLPNQPRGAIFRIAHLKAVTTPKNGHPT
jgi:signal transduction histidine kinase